MAGTQETNALPDLTSSVTVSLTLLPLKATVQISSVSQSNSYFNFINFTLSAPVSNFITIRGLAVTCRTLVVRSEEFRILDYTVFGNRELPEIKVLVLSNLEVLK